MNPFAEQVRDLLMADPRNCRNMSDEADVLREVRNLLFDSHTFLRQRNAMVDPLELSLRGLVSDLAFRGSALECVQEIEQKFRDMEAKVKSISCSRCQEIDKNIERAIKQLRGVESP